jgi:SRSO17 transposase
VVADAGTAPPEIEAAEVELEGVAAGLRPRFRRGAAHRHAIVYVQGLLSDVERKNGWQLAEHGGYSHPRTIQRVLDRSRWDADAVRDDLQAYVVEQFGDPAGVLVVDETGFLKKGQHSCGVGRQYSGTAGRIENCQIGVFLGYSSAKGRAGIDRELYLPREWVADAERRAAARVPDAVTFHTKPQLALGMIERALDAGVLARWVVADEVYGSDGKFRRALEARDQAYVVAVKSNEKPSLWPPYGVPGQVAMAALRAELELEAWHRLSCGEGAQGERLYDWAYVPLRPALQAGWVHGALFRRSLTRPDEVAYYLVYAPENTHLDEMAQAAGSRWAIEDVFKLAKGQVGLDQYEVRSWAGWYRHMTLALLALALLATSTRKRGTREQATTSCR